MQNQDKLNRLFEAAMQQEDSFARQAPSTFTRPEIPAHAPEPAPFFRPVAQNNSWQAEAAPAPSSFTPAPVRQVTPVRQVAAVPAAPVWNFVKPGEAPKPQPELVALQEDANEEFRVIIDQKIAARRRRQRRSFAISMTLLVGTTFGGGGWFVSDAGRREAVTSAIAEIRSAGDIKGIVAKYQHALDKVAVRGKQVDEATAMMGVNTNSVTAKDDLYMNNEMHQLMGPDGGPTVGDRASRLQQKFGAVKDKGLLAAAATPSANPK